MAAVVPVTLVVDRSTAAPVRRDTDDVGAADAPAPSHVPTRRAALGALALAVWVGIVAVGREWGLHLQARGVAITLYTPPVLGADRPSPPPALVVPVAVAVASVAVLPSLARRLRWGAALAAATACSAAWWAALASIDGWDGFTKGLEWEREWAPHVGAASADLGPFLQGFVARLPGGSVQVRGHPPGLLLLAGVLDRLGAAGEGPMVVVVLLAGLSAVAAVLLTVRSVVDERTARRALPFVVLTPAATWLVTSFDTLFVAVTAWFLFVLVGAMRSTGRRQTLLAALAGLLAVVAALLSYGMVLLALPALLVAANLRGWRVLVVAAAVSSASVALLAALGFSWFAGLAATKHEYDTLALDRPYRYFVVANLAAWALALGPAVAVGVARLRDRRAWALVGGGLLAALVADLSGLSEGEVERIWLPFSVWVVVATAALPAGRWSSRGWLSLQAGSALALNAVVRTYW